MILISGQTAQPDRRLVTRVAVSSDNLQEMHGISKFERAQRVNLATFHKSGISVERS